MAKRIEKGQIRAKSAENLDEKNSATFKWQHVTKRIEKGQIRAKSVENLDEKNSA